MARRWIGIRRGWVWVGLIREWNARHGRPPKWVAGQSERSTLPRNGGGFVGLLLCPLPRFPRNVRISEDCDQSRCLLAGTTSDAEPLGLLYEAATAVLTLTSRERQNFATGPSRLEMPHPKLIQ